MTKPAKKIVLFPYNPDWPKIYSEEAAHIKKILGPHCLDIHHIGSTSVPGLVAKQDIDIMCIVDDLSKSLELQDHGFVFKGEINIPMRYFFSKNTSLSKVNLHVVSPEHGFIPWNLTFRDYLRAHDDVRDAYGALKLKIIEDESSSDRVQNMMPRYTYDKSHFIQEVLRKAGFDDFTINFCFHKTEWEAYHRIRKEQIFDAAGKPYVFDDPSMTLPNHHHFVLYKGTTVVAVAFVDVTENVHAHIRELVVDTVHQYNGYCHKLYDLIETWARLHKFESLEG